MKAIKSAVSFSELSGKIGHYGNNHPTKDEIQDWQFAIRVKKSLIFSSPPRNKAIVSANT